MTAEPRATTTLTTTFTATAAIRTLPLRADITDGESVDSWIEALGRRHGITMRRMLLALGMPHPPAYITGLIYGVDPAHWRRMERAAGLPPQRLDSAVGDALTAVSPLRPGGSRFCPACLIEGGGRWQLAWRWSWSVACPRHRVLLQDRCPSCATPPRRMISGGAAPVTAGTCAHLIRSAHRRCGADLSAVETSPATGDVLDVQRWIEHLIAGLKTGQHDAAGVVADLPIVASWLLRQQPGTPDATLVRGPDGVPRPDAALTAAALTQAKIILGPDDDHAIAMLREIVGRSSSRQRTAPPGMSFAQWARLAGVFPNRFLRATDADLAVTDRLRLKTVLPTAARPREDMSARARKIPHMLWPDWSGRLLPVTGFHAELFRVVISACLLIPGDPGRGKESVISGLGGRGRRTAISSLFQGLADSSVRPTVTVLCRIADYLDEVGSPIDYQRRREQIPIETIEWHQWRTLACSTGAHPGDQAGRGRHLHVQRHLHQLLSGADLADRRHPLSFRTTEDRNRYVDFVVALPMALRRRLREHATLLLASLGIDEPLSWSPPAELADGLVLPGIDTDNLDMTTIHRLVVDERRPLGEVAQALGVHIEHVRIALERLDRPTRQWSKYAAPISWQRHQQATQLFTAEFFDREYVQGGRRLKDIAEATGFNRAVIARFAKQAGITLAKTRAQVPIDPDWLREQYCTQLRSTLDIAAELNTNQSTVGLALRRNGITPRPSGVGSFPQMLTALAKDIPADIRTAVEGGLHGWLRLHRFQIAMAFPTLDSAATYLDADKRVLVVQFQRLEQDIGEPLFHRAVFGKPQRPTTRGQRLLRDLVRAPVEALIRTELGEHRRHPMPGPDAIAKAEQSFAIRRPPQHRKQRFDASDDIGVPRIRISSPVLVLLRDLIDHDPDQFYGLAVHTRTGIDQGTLYPMLKRMLEAGWLTSWPEDEQSWLAGAPPGRGPGRRRTYYALTTEGRKAALHELAHRSSPAQKEMKPMRLDTRRTDENSKINPGRRPRGRRQSSEPTHA